MFWLGSLALAALPPAVASAPAPLPDADANHRAADGQVATGLVFQDGVAAGSAWAVSEWDVPVEVAWMAIHDIEAYPGRVGAVTVSGVASGPQVGDGRRVFQRLDLPLVADRWWVAEQHHDAAAYRDRGVWSLSNRTVHGDQAPGSWATHAEGAVPVAWSRGGWTLEPLPSGRTRATYWVWTDPGGRLPAGLASRLAPAALRDWMSDLEAHAQTLGHADRGGFVRPDGTAL